MVHSSDLIFFILTPSFNQDKFVGKTIESVLSQQNVTVKYVVMDGGSSDDTKNILQKFSKQMTWFSEKDNGQVDALNKGIEYFRNLIKKEKIDSNKVIFSYLNSDDYLLHPKCLEEVKHNFLKNEHSSWLVADALIVDEAGNQIQSLIRSYKSVLRKIFGAKILAILNPIPQPATFIRWETLEKVGSFNQKLRFTMDYEYWLRVLNTVGEPFFLSEPIAAFRIHKQSKGGIQFENQFREELEVAKTQGVSFVALQLHTLHSFLIVTIYRLIK